MTALFGDDLVRVLGKTCDSIKERLWIAVPYIGGPQSVGKILGTTWMERSGISVRLLTDIDEGNNFNSEIIKIFDEVGSVQHLSALHTKSMSLTTGVSSRLLI